MQQTFVKQWRVSKYNSGVGTSSLLSWYIDTYNAKQTIQFILVNNSMSQVLFFDTFNHRE